MRKTIPLIIAVALTAAGPAAAQGTDNNLSADTNAVVVGDEVAPGDDLGVATDPAAVDPANDLAAVPVVTDEPIETAPAPAKKGGFPWGVLGLLGLLGLIPRKRR